MKKEVLKILLLEDDPNDVELVRNEVVSSLNYEIDFKWVNNKTDFVKALESFNPGLILSDFSLPQFTGTDALKIGIKKVPYTPFIIVTGTLSEEAAADCILNGAWDYVVKERLHRLPRAIGNALKLKAEKLKTIKAEEELRKSEQWYKAIFENTGTATVLIAEDNTIILSNSWFEKLSGYTKEEVEKKLSWEQFVPKEDQERIMGFHLARINNEEVSKRYEFNFVSRSGEIKNILLTIDLIPDTKISVASLLNITDIKNIERRLSSSEEKFRLISNSAHDGIVMLNELNKINYWNPASEKIFGLTSEALINKSFAQLISYSDEKLKSFLGDSFDIEYHRADQSKVNLEISLAPLRINEQWGAVAIIRDITDRKIFEKELIQAKNKAEESDRLKSAFLATMSHELRTPLNAIIGFSSIINETIAKSEFLSMVRIINDSGNHLLNIIDSVFSLSLFQSGTMKVKIEPINLNEFVNGLEPYLQSKLAKENKEHLMIGVENDLPEIVEIESDKTKLTQLMINFLDNAVKYTNKGEIKYGIRIEKQDVVFYVRDTGIGVGENELEIIFEQFRQVEDFATRKQGGVGLGLSICKEIAVLLSGKVWVESELGKGSTFYFKLSNVIQ